MKTLTREPDVKELGMISARLSRAHALGEVPDPKDLELYHKLMGGIKPLEKVRQDHTSPTAEEKEAWQARFKGKQGAILEEHYRREAPIRRELRELLTRPPDTARAALAGRLDGFRAPVLRGDVVRSGHDATPSSWEEHVYPVSSNGDLRPENAEPHTGVVPGDGFGRLLRIGPKRWGNTATDGCILYAEHDTPEVVSVGIMRTRIHVTEGGYVARATSQVRPLGGLFMFSQGVRRGRFIVESLLVLKGSAVDPAEGSHVTSQRLLDFTFGTDTFRYGFFTEPGYAAPVPLTLSASVHGPGTLIVDEVINYFAILEDYDELGASVRLASYYAEFGKLAWEVYRPLELSAGVVLDQS
ncbi:MAG: hypothetical protein KA175_11130 [Flavobacteriales bacterium]|nr:hypothetical protein [Flavobacteriales bacterium]